MYASFFFFLPPLSLCFTRTKWVCPEYRSIVRLAYPYLASKLLSNLPWFFIINGILKWLHNLSKTSSSQEEDPSVHNYSIGCWWPLPLGVKIKLVKMIYTSLTNNQLNWYSGWRWEVIQDIQDNNGNKLTETETGVL